MSLAQIATPGLTFDEAEHRYVLDGRELPSVTRILRAEGLAHSFDASCRVVECDRCAHMNREKLAEKAALGTAVHAATHYHDEGDLNWATVDPKVAPFVEAWQTFLKERRVTLLALEQRIAHPDERFAGTIDRVARVDDGRALAIIDLKTGDPNGANFQTAGYARLAPFLKPLLTSFIFERWAVQLHPGRTVPYTVHPYRDRSDAVGFTSALNLFRIKRSA